MIYQPERILLFRIIKTLVPEFPGKTIDVGGGDGNRYKKLFNTDYYRSVDIDPKSNPDIIGDAHHLKFPSDSINTVLCVQLLEHVINPQKVLSEIYRILQPGGVCILTVPFFNELHSEPNDFWRFTKYGVLKLCENSRFKVISFEQRGGYFTCHAQMRIRKFIEKYNLYNSRFLMKIFRTPSKIYSLIAISLDEKFYSRANSKYALGWCLKLEKPKIANE